MTRSVLALLAVLAVAPSAHAATPCAQRVIEDWRDNGRVDALYELTCYEDAVDAIPADIRNYADADEVILRALQDAARTTGVDVPREPTDRRIDPKPPSAPHPVPPIDTSATTTLPLPLVVLAGMSVVLLAGGALGYVSRRRRPPRL